MPNPNIIANTNFSASVEVRPSNTSEIAPNFKLRASNVGLNARQEVNFAELIDGSIDRTAYGLGGYMVEGDLGFPMIHEGSALSLTGPKSGCSPFTKSLAEAMWKIAAARTEKGRLKYSADLAVVYPDNAVFVYQTCYVNQLGLKVAQQANVEMTSSWIGLAKVDGGSFGGTFNKIPNYLSPARIVTWNDFEVLVYSTGTGNRIQQPVDGEGIREFSVNLNNNIDRAFTLNGSLNPQDVFARKRQVNGTLKLLGRSKYLNILGEKNTNFFTSDEHMAFGYKIGSGNIYWATVLHGVIFRPEEMTLNPTDVFETSLNFEASGDCGFSFESLQMGTNPGAATLAQATATNYGGPSRDAVGNVTIFEGW